MSDSKQLTLAPASDTRDMDIWKFSSEVSNQLLTWNIFNIVAGVILGKRGGFLRGFASQNIGWGLINSAIALIGERFNRRRRAALNNPTSPSILAAESRNLRLILAVNGLLDVIYMILGRRLARGAKPFSMRRGIGMGVVLQAVLLFFFDWQMFRRSFWIKPS